MNVSVRLIACFVVFLMDIDGETAKGGWRAGLFGRRVRERRQQLGLTQDDLAAGLSNRGIPTTKVDVSRVEAGARRLTVDTLLLYAWVLDQPVVEFLLDDDGQCQVTPHAPAAVRAMRRKRPWPPKWREPATAVFQGYTELWMWLGFKRPD
jgi:transcriptional regulator with XRE-family HTH domain